MLKIIKRAGMYRVVFATNESTVLFSSAVRANCRDFISLWTDKTN